MVNYAPHLKPMSTEGLRRVAEEAANRLNAAVAELELRAKREARPEIPKDWEFFTYTVQFTSGGELYHYVARQREDGQIDVTGNRTSPFRSSRELLDWIEGNSAGQEHYIRRLVRSGGTEANTLYWDERA